MKTKLLFVVVALVALCVPYVRGDAQVLKGTRIVDKNEYQRHIDEYAKRKAVYEKAKKAFDEVNSQFAPAQTAFENAKKAHEALTKEKEVLLSEPKNAEVALKRADEMLEVARMDLDEALANTMSADPYNDPIVRQKDDGHKVAVKEQIVAFAKREKTRNDSAVLRLKLKKRFEIELEKPNKPTLEELLDQSIAELQRAMEKAQEEMRKPQAKLDGADGLKAALEAAKNQLDAVTVPLRAIRQAEEVENQTEVLKDHTTILAALVKEIGNVDDAQKIVVISQSTVESPEAALARVELLNTLNDFARCCKDQQKKQAAYNQAMANARQSSGGYAFGYCQETKRWRPFQRFFSN